MALQSSSRSRTNRQSQAALYTAIFKTIGACLAAGRQLALMCLSPSPCWTSWNVLPCLADLSLRVLEEFADPFEGSADVGTLRMDSPASHFS
jgi:hypothetical protein